MLPRPTSPPAPLRSPPLHPHLAPSFLTASLTNPGFPLPNPKFAPSSLTASLTNLAFVTRQTPAPPIPSPLPALPHVQQQPPRRGSHNEKEAKKEKKKEGKAGKESVEEAAAKARAREAMVIAQRRVTGHPVLKWAVHTETSSQTLPCMRWAELSIQPAADWDGGGGGEEGRARARAPERRSGHTLSRMREEVVLFGGSGDRGLFGDVWSLRVGELVWSRPAVTGKAPGPRAYHSAAARTPEGEWREEAGGGEQLILFGGSDSRRRLEELWVLSLPNYAWSTPNVLGSPPSARCWHSESPATLAFAVVGRGRGREAFAGRAGSGFRGSWFWFRGFGFGLRV